MVTSFCLQSYYLYLTCIYQSSISAATFTQMQDTRNPADVWFNKLPMRTMHNKSSWHAIGVQLAVAYMYMRNGFVFITGLLFLELTTGSTVNSGDIQPDW